MLSMTQNVLLDDKPLTAPQRRAVQKWVDALRSGQYPQTTGYLHNADGFCCMGVACDVFKKKLELKVEVLDNTATNEGTNSHDDDIIVTYNGADCFPPDELFELLGVENDGSNDVSVIYEGEVHTASSLNDTNGLSFKKIANAIEKTYLK